MLSYLFRPSVDVQMKKPLGQRIAFAVAILCYAAAVASGFAAVVYQSASSNDAIRASLMASVVFFIGCGVVLQVIGTARLKGILSVTNHVDGD